MADAAVYVMRAVGIPVGIDFLPQWPYRTQGHNWNVVLDSTGKIIMFMGAEDNPGTPHKPLTKKAKIYRNTYAVNLESLAEKNLRYNGVIPLFLRNPRIKDVTDEYVKCYDVRINVKARPASNNRFAYMAVFNNRDWIPVAWAEAREKELAFRKMEGGIVYMPCFYRTYGGITPAGNPVILKENGKVKQLVPDARHPLTTMVLNRIFPLIPDKFDVANFTGRFQGANTPDFKDAENLYVVGRALPFSNSAVINTGKKFRYVRYLAKEGKRCSIGGFAWYNSSKRVYGRFIGTLKAYLDDSTKNFKNVADGDFSTRFESSDSVNAWIGLDLGKQQNITRIDFAAPCSETTGTKIINGNKYELFYWGVNGTWVSKGQAAAAGGHVIFSRVPSNALYLLYNHSREKESPKRIFTYENGKQVWW
jgi:hypothetical protein